MWFSWVFGQSKFTATRLLPQPRRGCGGTTGPAHTAPTRFSLSCPGDDSVVVLPLEKIEHFLSAIFTPIVLEFKSWWLSGCAYSLCRWRPAVRSVPPLCFQRQKSTPQNGAGLARFTWEPGRVGDPDPAAPGEGGERRRLASGGEVACAHTHTIRRLQESKCLRSCLPSYSSSQQNRQREADREEAHGRCSFLRKCKEQTITQWTENTHTANRGCVWLNSLIFFKWRLIRMLIFVRWCASVWVRVCVSVRAHVGLVCLNWYFAPIDL